MIRQVAITQPYVPQYRFQLWDLVVSILNEHGIEGRVFFGGDTRQQQARAERGDGVEASWAEEVRTRTVSFSVSGPKFIHRDLPPTWKDALLLTEMQASNLNAWSSVLKSQPFVTFGHGSSETTTGHGIANRLEGFLNRSATHVLTYSPRGRDFVISNQRALSERVSSFNNSTDTTNLRAAFSAVSEDEIAAFNKAHGISSGSRIALYLGTLNENKRIETLIGAAELLLTPSSDWHLVVAGDGPAAPMLRSLSASTGKVSMLGHSSIEVYGPAARQASVLVNPGRVGLVAVDALAMGIPVLTCGGSKHAPEIDYLTEGANLFISPDDEVSFAAMWGAFTGLPQRGGEEHLPSIESAALRIAEVLVQVCNGQEDPK